MKNIFVNKLKLKETDWINNLCHDEHIGCGRLNDDGHFYCFKDGYAYQFDDKYKNTPIYGVPPCGGYKDGLFMISELHEKVQFFDEIIAFAALWGWADENGNIVIEPQYVYALEFENDKTIVCKGDWTINDEGKYWCYNQQWGIIDKTGKELVKCQYKDIEELDEYWIRFYR